MGEKSSEIDIEGGSMFSDTMRRAQNAYWASDWEAFKKIFEKDKKELLNDFDLFENTAISVAIRSDDPKLLKDLLEMLSEEERWLALTKPNCRGNTILHNISLRRRLSVQMVDLILGFEKKAAAAAVTLPEEEKEKRGPILQERKNDRGETPLFRAAAYGNHKMLVHVVNDHIAKAAQPEDNALRVHQYSKTETILHATINAQYFDVALWIISRMNGRRLLLERNDKNFTCLQLLACLPEAFRSHYSMGSLSNRIYNWLPDERYQLIKGHDDSSESGGHPTDIETGPHETSKPPTSASYLSRINFAVWNNLAQVFTGIESLWKDKRKHQLAKRLAEFLVKHDFSWQISYTNRIRDSQLQLPPVLYNVEKRKQQLKRKEEKEDIQAKDDQIKQHYSTPLFVAASNGIEEIVDLYLKEHRVSLNYMGVEGQNILHIAVRHRQLKIFKLLKKNPIFSSLGYRISSGNCTALHEVARMDYYRGTSQPGAAFKLQEELKWYKRVEKVVPSHLHLHCDNQALTAKDVLDMEHHEMLEKAREWIKQTAESCSTVAVLVATVVFAAAYTIPGGSEGGSPVFLSSPIFIFFTVMDIVALAFSLASVVMFLSILTSPFELWDFHRSLPQKLNLGFTFLFLALTTTMLAFCATILLTIRLPWKKWTSTLVYSAAFFPVTIFGLIEFPLYKMVPIFLHKVYKKATKATKAINPIGPVLRRFKKQKNQ